MTDLPPTPSYRQLISVFHQIGWLSFGGPAGQIALMQHELVERRGWVEQGAFLRALNLCHLLPGPEAQQLATWLGWRLHGVKGGLAAGLLFVLPGALVMLGLSLLYVLAAGVPWFAGLFLGIKAAVLAIVAQALWRIIGRALGTPFKHALAIAAFLFLALLDLPFPAVIAGAAIIGAGAGMVRPQWLGAHVHVASPAPRRHSRRRLAAGTILTVMVWCAIWIAPMALVAAALGTDHVLWDIGAFFSKLALVTFGGAYSVLAYMAQAAVEQYQWLAPGEMADGLGLAETTPGPLIMVTQFTGFLAAWRTPDPFSPLVGGLLGAGLTTWVTFAPCFLWIFACAPWMERLEQLGWLQSALAAITAAVVGVVGQLALWFALHVLFTRPDAGPFGLPDWTTLDWRAAVVAVLAALLLFRAGQAIPRVIAASALAGLLLGAL